MKWLSVICALALAGPVSAQTAFTITTGSPLPDATTQVAYSQQLSSSGGSAPISWSAQGSLPPGLSLGSSGAITGTPPQNASGTFTFGVLAVDSQGRRATKSFSLTVVQPPLTITTGSPLPNGNVGVAYNATLNASGGSGGYAWSSSGSLPPGLSFSSGRITGTPTTAGAYTFTISLSDSQEHSTSKPFSLTIQAPLLPLTITNASPLPNGAVGAAYNYSFDATGGVKPYTWSVSGAGLPDGLTLASGGSLTGTPTTAGQYSFIVRVDSAQNQGQGATKAFSLRITAPLSVTTPSPINAALGVPLTVVMTATGGTPQYLWSVAQGSQLPAGFTLDTASGFLSGTPATLGTFNFTVQATDAVQNTATKAVALIVQAGISITTVSPAPNASVGVSYSLTLAAAGGSTPLIWALDSGTLPAGLTLNPSTGVISGTPQTAGTSSFVIRVTDNNKITVTKSFSLTVSVLAPVLISATTLDFFGLAGGDAPAPQSLALITPAAQALSFTIQVDGGPGVPAPAWLVVRLLKGSSPARIPVAVDLTGLQAGKYTARILVNTSDGRQNIVTVTLTLTEATPQLEVSPDYLRFAGPASALAASEQNLLVRNSGGGGSLAFEAMVVGDAPWLRIMPGAGQAGPNAPALVRVLVNAQGLPLGPARATIRVTSAAGAAEIPVSLLLREEGPVIGFNVTGLRFEARDGNGNTRSKSFSVLNLGSGVVNWQAEIVSGADFVSLGATSGVATPVAPGALPLSVNPGDRDSGNYYALIKVTAAGALNSPQFITAMLGIADENSPPEPDPTPSGLFFVGKTGAAPPPAQVLRVFTSSTTPVPFQISANAADGGTWLSVSPTSGSASTSTPAQVNVTVTPGALSPGVYTGDVTVALSSTSIRATNVTLVVQPATAVSALSSKTRSVTGCTPARLALTQTGLVNSFAAPAGWPSSMVVRLADDCGDPVLNGQVVTTFSNGDPALALRLTDSAIGLYSATWAPGKVSTQMTVSARAAAPNLASATAQITGAVTPNKVPILATNGTRNTFNPLVAAPLAPGTVAQMYGSNLAPTSASPGVIPLPFTFNGTRVLIGALEAPLIFLSDGQLSVQIPTELQPNKDYPVVVEANGGYTLPDTLTIATAQPGVLTLADNSVFALHSQNFSPVTVGSPARQDEVIAVYLVGMGGTNPPIASGAAAPFDQSAPAATPPTVMIDGKNAEVLFAGLMPGTVGLYQIYLTVPAGVQAGSVPLVITQGGAAANASTLWVR